MAVVNSRTQCLVYLLMPLTCVQYDFLIIFPVIKEGKVSNLREIPNAVRAAESFSSLTNGVAA